MILPMITAGATAAATSPQSVSTNPNAAVNQIHTIPALGRDPVTNEHVTVDTPDSAVSGTDTSLDMTPTPDSITIDPFKVPEGGTVAEQYNLLSSGDSALTRGAKRVGGESANAMGQSRSSLAAGAAVREMGKQITPIAMADAKTLTDAAMISWSEDVKQQVNEYNLTYRERLDKLGYDNAQALAIMANNTGLISTLTATASNLLGNPNIENSEELVKWIIDGIITPGQETNANIVRYDFE